MGRTAVVITSASGPLGPDDLQHIDITIAADGGLGHARRHGIGVDVLVGDLDSVEPADLSWAEDSGIIIERHPVAKDATDLELAIETAITRGATEVTVLGGYGDRFDHLVGELALIASPRWRAITMRARFGEAAVEVLHGPGSVSLDGHEGSLLSLVPANGDARGISTIGLRYPLTDEDLPTGTTRGVSNVLAAPPAHITLRSGSLLIIRPHHHGTAS